MNITRRIILIISCSILILIGLFVPWIDEYTSVDGIRLKMTFSAGYAPVWSDHRYDYDQFKRIVSRLREGTDDRLIAEFRTDSSHQTIEAPSFNITTRIDYRLILSELFWLLLLTIGLYVTANDALQKKEDERTEAT